MLLAAITKMLLAAMNKRTLLAAIKLKHVTCRDKNTLFAAIKMLLAAIQNKTLLAAIRTHYLPRSKINVPCRGRNGTCRDKKKTTLLATTETIFF